MSQQLKLKAQIRTVKGSGGSNRLRRQGWIPAVLYGPDLEEAVPLQVNVQELHRIVPGEQRGIMELEVQEGDRTETHPVMIKEIQRDKVKGSIIHLDLYRVSRMRKVTTTVPIHLTGAPAGVKAGGVLQHQLWEVEIECLPHQIPEYLEADISGLEIGDVLTVKGLKVPEGVEVLTPADDPVVSVLAPTVEAEEGAGAEAPAEGEE